VEHPILAVDNSGNSTNQVDAGVSIFPQASQDSLVVSTTQDKQHKHSSIAKNGEFLFKGVWNIFLLINKLKRFTYRYSGTPPFWLLIYLVGEQMFWKSLL